MQIEQEALVEENPQHLLKVVPVTYACTFLCEARKSLSTSATSGFLTQSLSSACARGRDGRKKLEGGRKKEEGNKEKGRKESAFPLSPSPVVLSAPLSDHPGVAYIHCVYLMICRGPSLERGIVLILYIMPCH